jgi:arylsulfatase A-like enzyme
MTRRLLVIALSAGVVVSSVFAAMLWRALSERPPERVILIVIDSLRADHVGCYGSAGSPTPNIDALAAKGVRFAEAFAASSWTFESNASLLTGMYPHEVRDRRAPRLADDAVTLAEHFRGAGYATAAFSAHFCISGHYKFDQGFDTFALRERDDDATIGICRRWLSRHSGDRYFVLVYLWAPHWPYQPRHVDPETRRKLAGTRPWIARGMLWLNADRRCPRITAHPANADEYSMVEIEALHALYKGAIRDADRRVGEIVRAIGDDPRAVVAVTADHGEEWLDHGGLRHAYTLYRELLHVPLVLRAPGQSPRVVDSPTSAVDVVPTLLALAGIVPPPRLRGRSLLDGTGARPVFSEVGYCADFVVNRYAIRVDARAAIYSRKDLPQEPSIAPDGKWEAYDLARDPEEHAPLRIEANVDLQRLLTNYWRQAMARIGPDASRHSEPLDEETRKKLRALGYLTR